VGSIPPAGTIEFKRLNSIWGLSAYPPRIFGVEVRSVNRKQIQQPSVWFLGMPIETVIFSGAGASKFEGAPLQGESFRDYFSSPDYRSSYEKMDRELATFFALMFRIDVDNRDLSKVEFPTFEEVLGLASNPLDLDERAIPVRNMSGQALIRP
jgi:hypothetical protein